MFNSVYNVEIHLEQTVQYIKEQRSYLKRNGIIHTSRNDRCNKNEKNLFNEKGTK